jgi:hypothetical protein
VVFKLFDTHLTEQVSNPNNTNNATSNYQPTVQADHTFRTMANEFKLGIKSIKIGEKEIRRYLASRYHSRLATKMCALFDWSVQKLTFDHYDLNIKKFLQGAQGEDYHEQLIMYKTFAFNLFDVNCDNAICKYDLIALINCLPKTDLGAMVYADIMVLYKALEEKEKVIKYSDAITNQETGEIIDLEAFIKRAEKNKKLRPNFLKKIHKDAQKEIKLRKVKAPALSSGSVELGALNNSTDAPTTALQPAKTATATGAGTVSGGPGLKKR